MSNIARMNKKTFALAIHGGAGTLVKGMMTPDLELEYKAALKAAIDSGYGILEAGGTALDAVEASVLLLEDCPLFNAGKGSVFAANGTHEMDAAIMEGADRKAGAVAMVKGIKNPVRLARKVMEKSGHVLLAGEGAEAFARQHGCDFEEAAYFYNELRYRQWQDARSSDRIVLDHTPSDHKFGTVGAVALDSSGNLAAATSTGGMTNKKFGRIGDSPLIGAGTYADNLSCAVSCTGSGEFFIRTVAAHQVSMLMRHGGLSLKEACLQVVQGDLKQIGGDGGLIAVDAAGNICLPFNTEGMYRAYRHSDGSEGVMIYRD